VWPRFRPRLLTPSIFPVVGVADDLLLVVLIGERVFVSDFPTGASGHGGGVKRRRWGEPSLLFGLPHRVVKIADAVAASVPLRAGSEL
jgi:hypothetical protein